MWSILENVPCAAEKNVYSDDAGCNIRYGGCSPQRHCCRQRSSCWLHGQSIGIEENQGKIWKKGSDEVEEVKDLREEFEEEQEGKDANWPPGQSSVGQWIMERPKEKKSCAGTGCFSTMKQRAHMDGDVMIAGFFPLYTLGTDRSQSDDSGDGQNKPFIFNTYQFVLALAFAIEEINENPHILHNLTLGFNICNAHMETWKTFKNPFTSLFGKDNLPNYSCVRVSKSIAVLTGPSGLLSSQIGILLNLYRFPQLTFGPFDHALSDHKNFPALYQMASKDTSIAIALISLLLHFSWNWVGLLTSQDENGLWILPELKEEMDKNRICVDFELAIPTSGLAYVFKVMALYKQINKSSANVLIIHGDNEALLDMLHSFLKNIQFHNTAGDQVTLDEKRKLEADYDIVNIWNFPEGLELEVKVGKFSPYAHQLSLSEDMVHWAIGTIEPTQSACSESCGPGFRKSPQEEKAACCFDCTPCSENEIANGSDMEQCMKCPDHQYANTERNQCLPRAARFLTYEEPLGMALACMALSLSTLTTVVLGVFVKHKNTPIVKANNQALSYILLISLIFCFLCSLLFIGRPNTSTCILQQNTFGVVFTVAVSAVLAKTVTVVLAFKVTSPGRRMRWLMLSGAPNFIIPICTLIQVTLCGIWLGTSPPFIDTDAHSEHDHLIILCNKGSLTAFYCVLGYLGFLALVSFTLAFLARNLPNTFNGQELTLSHFPHVFNTDLPQHDCHTTSNGARHSRDLHHRDVTASPHGGVRHPKRRHHFPGEKAHVERPRPCGQGQARESTQPPVLGGKEGKQRWSGSESRTELNRLCKSETSSSGT
ncbi:vomeronasal type-2 receptor 116-like [Dipodomys merriami]|uniref:vomeronasal type-2 receptor 116-like n=1 Tax=Dipodomys merriami TaxID=94247 RepID=UPI003855DA5A